jgi:hypothetical protein
MNTNVGGFKKHKLEFSGLSFEEYVFARRETETHAEFSEWAGDTDFEFVEISDAEHPYIRLWSGDRRWVRCMRRIIPSLKIIAQMKSAQGVEVEVTELLPGTPKHQAAVAFSESTTSNQASPFQLSLA